MSPPARPHPRLVHVELGLQLAQQLGRELALALHLGQRVALGLQRLHLRLGGLGAVLLAAARGVQPVLEAVELRLVVVAQPLDELPAGWWPARSSSFASAACVSRIRASTVWRRRVSLCPSPSRSISGASVSPGTTSVITTTAPATPEY
jgi:hypothetical protein